MAYEQLPQYKPTEHQTPEPKVDHNAQPDSLGVHPSQKKKDAIVPNPLQPESPHKNLPPQLRRFNPDPNASELPHKLKLRPFTLDKPSEKDTDPNVPKLPHKLKLKPFTVDTRPKTTTLPNSNVVETVPNQTPEKVVGKDDPIVPQQVLNPAISEETQALNTPAKDTDPNASKAIDRLKAPVATLSLDNLSDSPRQDPPTVQSQSLSGMFKGDELIAANARFRPPNGPDRVCFDLLEIIEQLARELKNRFDDMLSDQHGLYIAMKTQQEYKLPKSVGTWEGHQEKYRRVQKELQEKFDKFKDNCDDDNDPHGYGFSESYALAEEYVSKAPPEHPSNVSLNTAPNWVTETIQNLGGQIVDGVIIIGKGIGEAAVFLLILFAKILSAPFERQV
jgi:hypothetical protein